MKINDKIREEKLEYFNRESANRKTNQYEYLAGEETLPPD